MKCGLFDSQSTKTWLFIAFCLAVLADVLDARKAWAEDRNVQSVLSRHIPPLVLIFLERDNISAHLIAQDLQQQGIRVNLSALAKDNLDKAAKKGDFHLHFSETWGPPYDPHSFAASWRVPHEGQFEAQQGLKPPMTKRQLDANISAVFNSRSVAEASKRWEKILSAVHTQATDVPLSYARYPIVANTRLVGVRPGLQEFDFPLHGIGIISGPRHVTVSPGATTGLFSGAGEMNPHAYGPNEFFANNWVYEGLVSYGRNGIAIPALAKSWEVTDLASGDQQITFRLRENVTFHDGAEWNASAAKLNFDHVLVPPLKHDSIHGWYELPKRIKSWHVQTRYEFVVETYGRYNDLLQELTYIRPLRMLSPSMFHGEDPYTNNSCPTSFQGHGATKDVFKNVTCVGIKGASGTGPFMYMGVVNKDVQFKSNPEYWGLRVANGIDTLSVVHFDSTKDVKAALMQGTLDLAIGRGPLQNADVIDIRLTNPNHLTVMFSGPLNARMLVMNTARPPTSTLAFREAISHALDKADLLSKSGSLDAIAETMFSRETPYCNFNLMPQRGYDLAKVSNILDGLFKCPADAYIDGNSSQWWCSPCPDSMTTLAVGRACVCTKNHYMSGDGCSACPVLYETEGMGAKSKDACAMSGMGIVIIAASLAFVLLSVACLLGAKFFVDYRLRSAEEARERSARIMTENGIRTTTELKHPMILIRATDFLTLTLDQLQNGLHEGVRELGMLKILDTMSQLQDFRNRGNKIMFWSYQRLSWDFEGPAEEQWAWMRESLQDWTSMSGVALGNVYIWLDILSIPQCHEGLKFLAVHSIYTYASMVDVLIVIAPSSIHRNTKEEAGLESYKSRVWCRVEQMAHVTSQGMHNVYVKTVEGLEDMKHDWFSEVMCVFDADMTCCRLKHSWGKCDRETLVLPLLGLWFKIVTERENSAELKAMFELISSMKSKVFPSHYDFNTESGVEQRVLFSDLIARVEKFANDPDYVSSINYVSSIHIDEGGAAGNVEASEARRAEIYV